MGNIKYVLYTGSPTPGDWGGPFSVGTDTLLLNDGSIGDTSTGQINSSSGTILGAYDFTVSTLIDEVSWVGTSSSTYAVSVYYSDDFSTWTSVASSSSAGGSQSFSAISARYWLITYAGNSGIKLTDFRVYRSGIALDPNNIGNAIVSQNGNLIIGTFNSPARVSQVGNLLIGNTSSPYVRVSQLSNLLIGSDAIPKVRISQLGLLLLVTSSNYKPTHLRHIVQSDPTKLLLLCDPNTNPDLIISGYRWKRSLDDITWEIIGDTSTPSFLDTITIRTGYRYRVAYIIGSSGESLSSDPDTYVPIPVILGFSVLINNTAGIYIQGS